MAETSFTRGEERPVIAQPTSPEGDRPDAAPAALASSPEDVDLGWWERALADAERAERTWRSRGREIVQIYRGDTPVTLPKTGSLASSRRVPTQGSSHFNILYANTEVMKPAVYSKPPQPVVRSRFVRKSTPPQGPLGPFPGMPGMLPGMPGMPPLPPGPPGPPGAAPPAGPGGPPPMSPVGGGPPGAPPGDHIFPMGTGNPGGFPTPPSPAAPGPGPQGPPMPPPQGLQTPGGFPPPGPPPQGGANLPAQFMGPASMQPMPPGMPPPQMMGPGMVPGVAPPAPGMPAQQDIDTAAAVMEKALEVVVADESSHEAIKSAVLDQLLPGRGVCRVRWLPQIEQRPVEDPVMGGPLTLPGEGPDAAPQMKDVKVWETVADEYVFWEDILIDPVRQFGDVGWIAFRHLFDEKSLLAEFHDSEKLQKYQKDGKLSEFLKWTEESAAKSPVGGGSAMKSSNKLDSVIRKAMVWEIWVKSTREVIWMLREGGGCALRVDPDTLGLVGFFPVPKPMLAVVTSDTLLPKAYFDLYAHLAADIEDTSKRISDLTAKIKVRGGYNSANKDIANLLTAEDGKMLPVEGVDLVSGGLKDHIWIVPILEWVNALKELYLSREQQKQAIYELMGISDIMRGATNPNETATAQRIKGSMGVGRMQEAKTACANFVRDLMRLKADIIAKNFDAETLTKMTGEEVTPEVFKILRSDFSRICSIDVETDSTVEVDETVEKEANAQIMQVVGGVMVSAQGLLQTGILPPPMVIQMSLEMIKMLLHPVRHSRGVIEMIDDFQEQLGAYMQMDPTGALMRPPPPPPPGTPAGPPGGPRKANGAAGPPRGPGGPPPPAAGPPGPPMLPPGGGPPPPPA